ncbi:uncharacterized protein LOC133310978 [Gastrolobium bilobum]|uniref:uncharacterized protein LOC133310978 n=1 Tax=Gastrolobium bilobum TaxID=150636 RepID=UPI002AB242CF|nr:uncharacterized protein LOC133310978 [Gastrolobium bilobum]
MFPIHHHIARRVLIHLCSCSFVALFFGNRIRARERNWVFVQFVSEEESLKLLVVREVGVECLKNFWDSGGSLEVAVEFLRNLASNSKVAEVLVSYGFVPRVVGVLNCGVMALRISAASVVYALGFSSTKARKELGECGCITPLVNMLDGKGVEEKESAAKALSMLMLHEGFFNLDKRYLVSLLASLVHSKNCRKQMVVVGACLYVQKLVDMDVKGSKKLLESLGRGKIWVVFARPWK